VPWDVPPEEDGLGILFAGFGIMGRNDRVNAAAHEKVRFDRHAAGPGHFDQVIQDLVGDRLMERALVPVAPEIELEAFQLHAELIGYVRDADRREIRLTGLGAKTREFRTIHLNIVFAARIRILEDLKFFRGLYRHNSPYIKKLIGNYDCSSHHSKKENKDLGGIGGEL
jgi:hypothetical protein